MAQEILEQIILWTPKIGIAIFVFLIFWLFSKITRKAIHTAGNKAHLDDHITNLLGKTTQYGLMAFGVISALGTLGINVSALVAGLGLTGFALGFALKDTISNLLSGVLLLIYKPFEINDHIKVSSHQGKVISIDLRYTTLEEEGTMVLIPNSNLFTNPITLIK